MIDPLELSRLFSGAQQPVLGTDGVRILFANPCASNELGFDPTGCETAKLIPSEVFTGEPESYACSALIGGRAANISVSRQEGVTLLFFNFHNEQKSTMYLTRNFISNLRNNMTGLKLSVDRFCRANAENARLSEKYTAVLYHYYYCLLRTIRQLDSADLLARREMLFTPVRSDLVRLCSEITDTVSVLCRDQGAPIRFTTNETELFAVVDPELIEQMLLNLFSNSLQHTKPDGRITLTLSQRDKHIVLSVDDNGEGIPQERLPSIFSLPEDPAEPGAAGGGLGLGLYIASGIAQLHGGVLLIESRACGGTRVRVMLPTDVDPAPKFKTPETDYRIDGVSSVLTAMADALPSSCYGPKFED
ncbi:MAG: sensor histidine kinase [Oscillospiraceae bacterium]